MSSSSTGGLERADRLVIRSQAELEALKARLDPQDRDRVVPDGAIDFRREMLIAVFMGELAESGHMIEITEIERRPMPTNWREISGLPRPPSSLLVVELEETHETGGIALPAKTAAFHVVKLTRENARVQFEVDAPTAPSGEISFELVSARDTGGPGDAKRSVIRSDRELQRFFEGSVPSPVTNGVPVDFRTEMMIAISLGHQSQTGHGVAITGIWRDAPRLSAEPEPGLPVGLLTIIPARLTINYLETHEPRTRIPTRPYVVVKLLKLPIADVPSFVRALTAHEPH